MVNTSMLQNDSWFDVGPQISVNSILFSLQRGDNYEHRDKIALSKLIVSAIDIVDLTSRIFRNKIQDELK